MFSLTRRRTSGCTGARAAWFGRFLRYDRAGPVNLVFGGLRERGESTR